MKFRNQKLSRDVKVIGPTQLFTGLVTGITTLILLISGSVHAQGYIEGANMSYEFMPMKIENAQEGQKFRAHNIKIGTTVPIFLKEDKSRYLLVGGNLEAFDFAGSHPDFEVDRVYSISPTFGYSTMLTKNFNLTALLMPILNGDYKSVKVSDIKFGAVARGSWKFSENLTWRITLGYRGQFYGPQYIGLVGMDWKVNEKWRIFGDIPNNATVSYGLNEKTNAGFNLFVQPTTYRLKNQERYFDYNTVNPGLFAERYIAKNWAIRATVAYTMVRNVEVYDKQDKTNGVIDFYDLSERAGPVNPEISKGLIFKIGLSYRIFPGKK
jgi:hypothetical protein